jgi:hypothetical protein
MCLRRQTMYGKGILLAGVLLIAGLGQNATASLEQGYVRFDYWFNLSATTLESLMADPRFPDQPDRADMQETFVAGAKLGSQCGVRAYALLEPPQTGDYEFWLSGGRMLELWLSSDGNPANATLVLSAPPWTPGGPTLKKSSPISLHADRTYYIEARLVGDAGDPGLMVQWVSPTLGRESLVISGDFLATWGPPTAWDPMPQDGAVHPSSWVTLQWKSGASAALHDVYFGEDLGAVSKGVRGTLLGRQVGTVLQVGRSGQPYPEGLIPGATYYWRVDEVNDMDPDSPWRGQVWSFSIAEKLTPWVPFLPNALPGAAHAITVIGQDNMGITVNGEIPGMFSVDATVRNEIYQKLSIPYGHYTTAVGKPMLPIVRTYVEVPHDVNVTVETIPGESIVLDGYNVYPAQPPRLDGANGEDQDWVIDKEAYATDIFYPEDSRLLGETIIMRDHRILPLVLNPVQFNPVRKQLRIYPEIRVRIRYNRPAQIAGIRPRLESEAFETLCSAYVVNYKPPHLYLTRRLDFFKIPGADYLIITANGFKTQAETLADWKTRKGLRTKVVTLSDISSTGAPSADDIADYLQDAYDTWSPVPAYVLLLGDADSIPVHYRTPHPSPRHGGHETATDLYYGTLDGTDAFPDVFVGRVSVDTSAQAGTVVGKLVNYERNPPTDTDFYREASMCAYFQDDDDDGYEDRRFVLTCEEIRDYLVSAGYTVERIYNTNSTNPRYYNNGQYNAGDPLPTGIVWNGNAARITAAFNDGRWLMVHRDHGGSCNYWDYVAKRRGQLNGWGDPEFTTTDIPGLNHGNLLPVVLSINCQSGWFDGETDPNGTWNCECFCEELLRRASGGAVAAVGATRNSYSGYNDDLTRGMIDAVWPDFDPTLTTGAMYELGQMLTYGKVHMAVMAGGMHLTTFELFHLFGDPEMQIWTARPATLAVTHPSAIGSGNVQEFVVTVRDGNGPVAHALVGLFKANDLQVADHTDPSGDVVFRITPSTGGTLDVTVTAHNYRPYQGAVTVTSGGAKITISPKSGPPGTSCTIAGSAFSGGETVALSLGNVSLGAAAAVSGAFSAARTAPSISQGLANVIATGQSSGRSAVTSFRVLPVQPLPDPYSYCQWDSSTWSLDPSGGQVWDSPAIRLRERNTNHVVASSNLTIGTTYTIEATIYNNSAQVAANNTQVTFTWADIGAGQGVWHLIDTDTVNVPAAPGTVVAQAVWTPTVTGHCCIRAEIYHPWDTNLQNNMGQENTTVLAISSPAEMTFEILNPTKEPGVISLDVVQRGAREVAELWETHIDQPQAVLAPGQGVTATLRVRAPDMAPTGESRTLSITAALRGRTIGGIDVTVVKDQPPVLTDGTVAPESGPTGTSFTYRVTYTDQDNHRPLSRHPLLHVFKAAQPIAGSPFVMQAANLADTRYTDGKEYFYQLTLADSGDYTYFFQASDTLGVDATGPATRPIDGPLVTKK